MVTNGTVPTFGLWYDLWQKPPLGDYARFYPECFEEIEEAERLGYTGVWLSEHHFVDDGYVPSPLVVAAAVAARTQRMTIRTNVLLLPLHHPLRVAEDAAVADLVSSGRFVLGVGLGYVQHEFEVLGFNRKYRPSLFEENAEIIRRAWKKGRIGYDGKLMALRGPAIRAELGGGAPDLHRRLRGAVDRSRRPDGGWVPRLRGRGEFVKTYRRVREAFARYGRADEDFPFVASRVGYVHEYSERARSDVAPAIAYQRSRYAKWGTDRGKPKPEPIRPEDLPWERYFVDHPGELAEGLARLYERALYDHLCFWARLPGLTHEQALESMRLFASKVAPRVRDAVKA